MARVTSGDNHLARTDALKFLGAKFSEKVACALYGFAILSGTPTPCIEICRGPVDPRMQRECPLQMPSESGPPAVSLAFFARLLALTIRNFPGCVELIIPRRRKDPRRYRCNLSSSEPALQQVSASSPQQPQQHRTARRLSRRQKISSSKRSGAGIALGYGARASSRMSAVNKAKAIAGDTGVNAVAIIVGK